MPILGRQSDIYPEDLLWSDESTLDPEARWWAIYTLPRREKDLMRRLQQMKIAHYGPLIRRRHRSPSGRSRTSYLPLFPSYLFLFGSEEDRYRAMTSNCISRYMEIPDAEQLVADLRQIHRLISADAPMAPEARIESGMKVRVRGGALAGLEGKVVRRQGGDRLVVEVRFLQQGASVELDDYQVERIDL
jgi:transcription antitermination factor NusG